MTIKPLLLSTFLVLSALSTSSLAAPRLEPVDTLSVSVRTVWPVEATSVKDAILWITEPLGYTLITDFPAPPSAVEVLAQPIPAAAKLHRTMPVLDAIQILIGLDNTIVVDKTHRLITVQRGS